jgi:phosphoenolpyruvate carboxykinase (GTP)
VPGWKVETIGDDIAWMRPGVDGKLRAINPERGFFGVAPGTGITTNPTAVDTVWGNSIFTNVALRDDGDVWWEGLTPKAPSHLIDWQGNDWTPDSETPAAHPNSRFTVTADQCPTIADEWDSPEGVVIDAILFGGRRPSTVPLVSQARDWSHGVFMGATMASETTAAAEGAVGRLRHDPFAMLPFCGYNITDFSENSRVLEWIVRRIEGEVEVVDTPVGKLPRVRDFNVDGLDIAYEDLQSILSVDREAWTREVGEIASYFDELGGDRIPEQLVRELVTLRANIR